MSEVWTRREAPRQPQRSRRVSGWSLGVTRWIAAHSVDYPPYIDGSSLTHLPGQTATDLHFLALRPRVVALVEDLLGHVHALAADLARNARIEVPREGTLPKRMATLLPGYLHTVLLPVGEKLATSEGWFEETIFGITPILDRQ